MRTFLPLLLVFAVFCACEQKSDDRHDHTVDAVTQHPLYKEVMAAHDEVMPKMDDLYQLKRTLQTRQEMPGISPDEEEEIRRKIAAIDSASEGMMVWMRQFNPPQDTAALEAYLRAELVKVQKVREDILSVLN